MADRAEAIDCDLAVVGAGPAGIAAAAVAAEAGQRVVLLDESPRPGGQIWRNTAVDPPRPASLWLRRLARSGASVESEVTVVDAESNPAGRGFRLTVEQRAAPRRVVAERLVLATGARELFLPFPGWTLPNVVGIGGAQALLKSGMSFAGLRVVIAGSGPLLLPVSAALAAAGAHLLLVAEQAPLRRVAGFASGLWRHPRKLMEAARYRGSALGTPYRPDSWVVRARGGERVEEVDLRVRGRPLTLQCDLLCTGFGLVPNLSLARLLGCAVDRTGVRVDATQRTSVAGVWCAGEGTGVGGVEAALAEGVIAGAAAAGRQPGPASLLRTRDSLRGFSQRLRHAFAPRRELSELAASDTIVCRCEDVRRSSLDGGWTGRQAKLYTRIGMGPCQGRVCGPAAEHLFGWKLESDRMPVSVATIDTLAGAGED